ncbi:MAG: Rieske 2Fe-2S domain-containing protein [Acidimicrobiales bacterium]|nr:Rieske 2Fe-2S domain-containing protein [Acidimicrobiales bacterium]
MSITDETRSHGGAAGADQGTAYGKAPGEYDRELAEVGPGTPMGELLRRYWHPIGPSEDATEVPKQVRLLGEDLILFRNRDGRPGLVHPRCIHRGTSLLYARVDDCGIRCCYHGWAFDTQGNCTDQPCEPHNGQNRDKFRQPWYPADERYGLVWAYIGPPERKPLLPRYSTFENLDDDEQLFTDDKNIGSGRYFRGEVPFNWFQHFENILDPAHFMWLHFFHSGPQFGSRYGEFDTLDFQPWERLDQTTFATTETGVAATRIMDIPDGRSLRTVTETVLPGIRGVSNPFGAPGRGDALGFVVPVDDTHFRIFTVLRGKDRTFFERIEALRPSGEPDFETTQRFPGDWEAMKSMGEITLHSDEHLASSDRGVRTLRRLFREQMENVAGGGDPLNVAFDEGDELVQIECGQYFD